MEEERTPEQIAYEHKIRVLTLYIITICRNILIKTRRRVFPRELKGVVVDLVVEKFKLNATDEDIAQIQSLEEYDRKVDFGISSVTRSKLDMWAKAQLKEHESLINEYRLLYRVNLPPKLHEGDYHA